MMFFNKKMPTCQRLILFLFIFSCEVSAAQSPPNYDVSDDTRVDRLNLLHWVENDKSLTPEDATKNQALGSQIPGNYSIPMTDAAHWFAFTLTNTADYNLSKVLYLRQAYPTQVNLHYQEQGEWLSQLNGTDVPLNKRKIKNILPVFQLELEPYESKTYYIEVHSKVKLLQLNFFIATSEELSFVGDTHHTIVNMYVGAALLLSIINALMFISFRDYNYLYYSGFILSFIAATLVINSRDLYLDIQIDDRSFLLLAYHGMIIFLSLFIGSVIGSNKNTLLITVLLRGVRLLAIVVAVLTFIDGNYFSYTLVSFIPISVMFVGGLIYSIFKGAGDTKLITLGVSLFLSGAICTMLVNAGIVPDNVVTVHGIIVGSIAENILFSIALFNRVLNINKASSKSLVMATESANVRLENTIIEQAKQLNKAKLEAEESNDKRVAFFANINHEMRTPLNGILGIIDVLKTNDDKPISSRHFKTLKTSSNQLASLINNVLDHSKLQNDIELETHPINFNIPDLVNNLKGMFSDIARDKGLLLKFHVQSDLVMDRYGDNVALQRILINLLGNAIKFTHTGRIDLTIFQGLSDIDVVFSLSDTGDGIEEDQLEDIFTAYHQTSHNNRHGQPGSGLGLTISKTLSEAMGGKLSVTSKLGKGTQFDACLPLNPLFIHDKYKSNRGGEIACLDLSDKCVLVVDDSRINQEVVHAFLSHSGITIIVTTDGEDAVKRFEQGGIDIVLMDLHMSVMGGIAATHKIRAFETNKKLEHCPIIIHTADTAEKILEEANEAGADYCLYKPYTQEELIKVLCDFLGVDFEGTTDDVFEDTALHPLVGDFLEQTNESINDCRRHIDSHSFEALAEETHKMIGSCGLFRARSLQATLTKMNTLSNESRIDKLALLALLTTATDQLKLYQEVANRQE